MSRNPPRSRAFPRVFVFGLGLVTLTACEEEIDGAEKRPIGPRPAPDAGPDPDIVVECPTDSSAGTLDEMATRFAEQIDPLMTRGAGGCVACHAADSERLMKMANNGRDTFFRVRASGYLRLTSGGMTARVLDDSMPQGGPAWTQAEKDLLLDFTCDLATRDEGGTPPDEEFPPDLLSPYAGPAITDYDNTFLNYDQLRGRVLQVFDDEWVREGVDRFSENISLFGGVDFIRAFVPARQATPEFFVGLDLLAEDVCGRAAADQTGPFAGLDLDAPIASAATSTTVVVEAEDQQEGIGLVSLTGDVPGCAFPNDTSVNFCTTGGVRVERAFPSRGDYRIVVRAEGQEAGPDLPQLSIRVDGVEVEAFGVPAGAFANYEVVTPIEAGTHIVDAMFTNDFYDEPTSADRNLLIDKLTLEGPLAGTTDGSATGEEDAFARLRTLFARILLRVPLEGGSTPETDELTPLYGLLTNLEAFDGNRRGAWAGVCQGLLNHPDFLFTRPPSFDFATAGDRERLLLIKTALDLLDRAPSEDEFGRFALGEGRDAFIAEWLRSEEFAAAYYARVRQVLEYDGTPDGDEPARLWTWIAMNDRPLREVLTADYTVNEALERVERPAEHGATGVLTMKGYIKGKPGLPHYNYAARVFTGFMGFVFEVPQEALDARATASAASTVEPTSICFSCHKILTPLAHQRLKWDDNGIHRDAFDDGRVIDDTDHDLVADYPFRGPGIESFSLVAVRKETFIRRMVNVHFLFSFGRLLRHDQDERDVYFALWNAAGSGAGTFRDLMEGILQSRSYTNPPTPTEQP